MDEQLKQLVLRMQQHPHKTEERQQTLTELVDRILRSRKIFRSFKGQPLLGISLDGLHAVKQQLQHDLDQSVDRFDSQLTSVREWANSLLNHALKQVLNEDYLQQLALQAQQCQPQTEQWQYALEELLNALQLSDKLYRPTSRTAQVYDDAMTKTLWFICQNIHTYDPARGKFLSWVTYRHKMIVQETLQDVQDPLIQSVAGKIIRTKYQLNGLIRKINKVDVDSWLVLNIKSSVLDSLVSMSVALLLIVLWLLYQLMLKHPELADSLLFEMAKASLPLSSRQYEMTGELATLETIAQPDKSPCLSEKVRQYIQDDPQAYCQKYIRGHPKATFQAIALARLDGKSWKEMSEVLKIDIPALSNFFQRRLKELAPEIKSYIQD